MTSLIVCRCELVEAHEIEDAIARLGCRSVNEVKKLTRAGMGPCQGKVCARLVELTLVRLAGAEAAAVPPQVRPPVRPVALEELARLAPHMAEPAGTVNAAVVWGLSRGARGTLVLEPVKPATEDPA
jgi:bacterioferritin-associated ferredoxin